MTGLLIARLAEAGGEAKPEAEHEETGAADTEPEFEVEGSALEAPAEVRHLLTELCARQEKPIAMGSACGEW